MPDVERRICPPEYQERLTRAVGVNQYGEPNFIIEWGQSRTYTAGGVWPHDHFLGYRQLMLSNSSPSGKGQPCWMILEWHPPQDYGAQPAGYYPTGEEELVTDARGHKRRQPVMEYRPYVPGSPEMYYFQNRDDATGLQTLGEYPYKGRYEVAFKLVSQEFRDGKLWIVNYHLDGMVLDILIPAIVECQRMTMKERLRAVRLMEEKRDRDMDRQIDAIYNDRRKHVLPSVIADRERLIQKQMSYFLTKFGRVQPGFTAGKFSAA